MLCQHTVGNAYNVRRNPVHRLTEARKSPMDDHDVSPGDDRLRFVLQRCWEALDKIEQAFTARRDMGAVLNVGRRPVALGPV